MGQRVIDFVEYGTRSGLREMHNTVYDRAKVAKDYSCAPTRTPNLARLLVRLLARLPVRPFACSHACLAACCVIVSIVCYYLLFVNGRWKYNSIINIKIIKTYPGYVK